MPAQKQVIDRSSVWSLTIIAILVVLVRAILFPLDTTQTDITFDIDRWVETARNIVAGKGYSLSTFRFSDEPRPTAMRGPTVVYFFAAVLWLFGDNQWSILIAQWLLDAATAVVLFFIAMEIFRDRRVALIASLLFAFYLPGLIFTFRGWSEPLFTLVLAAFTLCFLRALRRPSAWRFATSGALLGVATLARPSMQFFPLLLLPVLWWALNGQWRQVISAFTLACLSFAAVLSPWAMRNYIVFNAFIPASSYSGVPLYESNFALGEADYLRQRSSEDGTASIRNLLEARFGPVPNATDLGSYAKLKGLNELEVNKIASREVVKLVREYPDRYALLSIVRFFRVWFHHRFVNFVILGEPLPKAWLIAAFNGFLLALAGAAVIWFRGPWVWPAVFLVVLIAYSSAIYAATNAVGRYSVPMMPYVMVFAAYTIIQLLTKPRRMRSVTAHA
jgi:4-amino-4-deoxy-L-arabinose transferase-like glycosyltransferase